jgi:ketosteroid isomerase-like protein
MASTLEVGQKLVELCRQNRNVDAVNQLYAQDVVSVEVADHPGMPARQQGIDAIRKKNEWWIDNHTIHNAQVSGPFPHGDRFVVHFKYDVTSKAGPMAGKRMQLEEAGLYTVRDGKVAQEEFFYHMG